jgi:hypothetical protein
MTPEQLRTILKDHDEARSRRSFWEGHWQDIRELVRPAAEEVRKVTTPGRVKTQYLYDSTAVQSNEQLASGLQSYLMSPTERWFDLQVKGLEHTRNHDTLLWLELVADTIYNEYSRAESSFNGSMSELFMDLGSYGSGTISQEWDANLQGVKFRAYPMRDLWFRENVDGRIDSVHRSVKMFPRQIIQAFGSLTPKMNLQQAMNNPDRQYEVIHIVRPRADRDINSFAKTDMPFASYWVCRDTSELIEESGYRGMPYHTTRWIKLSDEIYGRSPAMTALPDIKMINVMARTLISVSQKAADPPLIVPHDGFLLPLRTSPGSLIFKEPNVENIEVLPSGDRNLPITREILIDWQGRIKLSFHADWLELEKQNKEMTAFEVQERLNSKLRQLAPVFGRQETELLGPTISRTFNLLSWHDKLPPPPPEVQGRKLKIVYTSPAAKAQESVKALEMERFVAESLPLAQADPSVLDVINFDKLMMERARYRGISRVILRPPAEVEEIRAARQQQEQLAAAAQIAEPATKAMKNLADAQQLAR